MLRELRLSEGMTKKWMDLLESGYDEPLKVILIALCEGLRELSYITYDTSGHEAEEDPLGMLSTSIRSIYLLGSPQSCQWPVGFKALRSIIVSEPCRYRHSHESFSSDSATVAPLFLLPEIRELRLTLIGYRESGDYVWEWDEAVSSVKDLQIINPDLKEKSLASFVSACRALQSFTYDRLLHEPLMCASLLKHAKHSLEELRVDEHTSG
ncbi:hypothetical protein EPUS_02536 [Endocarpon pusillum Z07020]|uniref:Uncharacterized protein n=1 Tax=Endocarpon pusillum (strain Z07020 / HMAS-L-300199) TaxID=1263415 RepID=U1HKC5_ENDPU|nr:uncharacterized protein EPUS_02536 [Endocarpon pusillum Z07020]ERF70670.1 hypothetical protein EPUS_02536 [Endocarpon pusillum Z07020]